MTSSVQKGKASMHARERIGVVGMFLGVFAVGIDSFVISPLLSPMSSSMTAAVSQVAFGVTAYAIAYAVSAPLLAPLGDHFNPGHVGIVGIFIFSLATLATSFQNTLGGFYVVRALAGVGGAMFTPNIQAYVTRRYDPVLRSKLIGIIMAGLSASIVLGVPLGSWAASVLSWRQVFPFIAALGACAGVILAITLESTIDKQPTLPQNRSLSTYILALATPRVRYAICATLAWMTGFYGVYTFLGAFLEEHLQIGVAQVGTYLMVYGAGNFAASFSAGWVNSRLEPRHRPVIIFGFVSALSVVLLTTVPMNPATVIILFLLWAAAQGYAATALIGLAASAAPAQVSTVLALNSSFIYIGLALGSAVFGALLPHGALLGMGIPAALFTLAAMISAATASHHNSDPAFLSEESQL